MNNSKKCPHGYELGPDGEHIIPNGTAVSIEDAAYRHFQEPPLVVHGPTAKKKPINEIRAFDRMLFPNKEADKQ